MNLSELYNEADKNGIKVECFALEHTPCLSIMNSLGECFIGIDPMQLKSELQEKAELSHELGHCLSGAFYNRYSTLCLRSQCEYRADVWAIKKLIPQEEYKRALIQGNNELWSLAEHFEVPEEFMKKAINYYSQFTA